MIINFYLRYSTQFGQSLFLTANATELGNSDVSKAIALEYVNTSFWKASINIDTKDLDFIQYAYILRTIDKPDTIEFGDDRIIDLQKLKVTEITTIDTWSDGADYRNNFYTQAFQQVLLNNNTNTKEKSPKDFTHHFKVKAPILNEHEIVCIAGSSADLNNWSTISPILLHKNGNWWSVKLNLKSTNFPSTYKYGTYNIKTKQFVRFETGENRELIDEAVKEKITVLHDGYIQFNNVSWKGAGVAIPVFSLRSKNSFGTGEFTDINLLVDWAKQTGLKLIQLLPINDTTANHTWTDCYPYAAISAFALHPLYLNLQKAAGKINAKIVTPLLKKQKQLNSLAVVDYEQVMKFKTLAIKELYLAQKELLHNDVNYFNFFELNRHWLVPYAAFCYLRDKYNTPDFNIWKGNSQYNETNIQRLVSVTQRHYDDVAVHYFTQYHLHLQLKDAVAYAHKKGIVIKGDLPIGIYRYSVDAWVNPSLYNMDAQAGAPPDDFAIKGQNWGFPTYNWAKMKEDNFTWWRQRFEQMSNYFDAFRIDHVLGFFRIWSIPVNAVEGLLGHFVPALPVHINELIQKGIAFNFNRFCKPFITEELLQREFGADLDFVKNTFLDNLFLKSEFDTQKKVEAYFKKNNDENSPIKIGLYNLISNVILLQENEGNQQEFHFRISMEQSYSFQQLDAYSQQQLKELYINYFYYKQDDFWKKEAMQKLPGLMRSTNMLVCGEDLGMVPHCVPDVMRELSILSLEIQRMPKQTGVIFLNPAQVPYLSVITPSTHDMSTLRAWWEENPEKTQQYFNTILGKNGDAPFYGEPWIIKEILNQHLYSPAMWSIFQLQDILGMSSKLRRENPTDERINNPANPNHYWQYRMHLFLEDLIKEKEFNAEVKTSVVNSGR
jgi:4-alpha-glucanotransferase